MMDRRRVVKKTYSIDPSNAGAVIGRKGAGIAALKEIPDVRSIFFDTKSSPTTYKLTVTGASFEACEKVFCEIQRRIKDKIHQPGSDKIYIDVDNTEGLSKIVLEPVTPDDDVVYRSRDFLYRVSRFAPNDLSDALEGLGISYSSFANPTNNSSFHELHKDLFIATINDDLRQHDSSGDSVKFTASPGKLAFKSSLGYHASSISRSKLTANGKQYLKDLNLTSQFSPMLNTSFLDGIAKNLMQVGFKKLNNEGEKFTIIHLFSGPENTFFHVQLADNVGDDLRSTSGDTDMRLTSEKKVCP